MASTATDYRTWIPQLSLLDDDRATFQCPWCFKLTVQRADLLITHAPCRVSCPKCSQISVIPIPAEVTS
jgi:transcription elongation factor Elf1